MAGKGKGKSKDLKKSNKNDAKGKAKKAAKKQSSETTGSKINIKEAPQQLLSNVKTGVDSFTFPNGDLYLGGFEATIEKHIHRQGLGAYITTQKDLYKGEWDADILNGEVNVTYADGSSYKGKMQEFKYNGEGKYKFPNAAEMCCEFVNNIPVNEIIVTDPLGHFWYGNAEKDGVLMKPENHFLLNVKERIATASKENKENMKILSNEAMPGIPQFPITEYISKSESQLPKISPDTVFSEQEEIELVSSDLEKISKQGSVITADAGIEAVGETHKGKPKSSNKSKKIAS